MAGHRTVLLLVALAAVAVTAASASSSEESSTKPAILMPGADTPLPSYDGADGPVADDALEDEEAAPVGAPIGTTMTEPRPLLILTTPPGFTEADVEDGGTAAPAASVLVAAVVAAAGVFASF